MPKAKENSAEDTHQALRDQVLLEALKHVPFDGWTQAALDRAEDSACLAAGSAYRAFPDGLSEMAAHASDYFDRQMLATLETLNLSEMKIRDRVTVGVRARIEACSPYKEAHRRLLGYIGLPTNKPLGAKLAWETCNRIWYAAGDDATDFNYYTKRGLLFPVYTTTVLYWHADTSDGAEDTWGYLDRRIADVLKIPGYQARFKKTLGNLPNPFRILKRSA